MPVDLARALAFLAQRRGQSDHEVADMLGALIEEVLALRAWEDLTRQLAGIRAAPPADVRDLHTTPRRKR